MAACLMLAIATTAHQSSLLKSIFIAEHVGPFVTQLLLTEPNWGTRPGAADLCGKWHEITFINSSLLNHAHTSDIQLRVWTSFFSSSFQGAKKLNVGPRRIFKWWIQVGGMNQHSTRCVFGFVPFWFRIQSHRTTIKLVRGHKLWKLRLLFNEEHVKQTSCWFLLSEHFYLQNTDILCLFKDVLIGKPDWQTPPSTRVSFFGPKNLGRPD